MPKIHSAIVLGSDTWGDVRPEFHVPFNMVARVYKKPLCSIHASVMLSRGLEFTSRSQF